MTKVRFLVAAMEIRKIVSVPTMSRTHGSKFIAGEEMKKVPSKAPARKVGLAKVALELLSQSNLYHPKLLFA